jgi:hypothetical protein
VDYVNGAGNRNRTRVLRITRALLWSSVSYTGGLLNGGLVVVVELPVVLSVTTFVFEAACAKFNVCRNCRHIPGVLETLAQREKEIIRRASIWPLDILDATAESVKT